MLLCKRSNKKKNVIDIAILLDSNQYIEYSMTFRQKDLTYWVADRIKDLFSSYKIDAKSDIMTNSLLYEHHPIYVYLTLLHTHIPFQLRKVNNDQILKRIHSYIIRDNKKPRFNALWKSIIEKEVCPWITQKIDYALQNKTPGMQQRMKFMRMGMFYMIVKNYVYAIVKKSINKRKMMLNSINEETSSSVH